jgi:Protein of unknown function (DUF3551)
LRAESAFAGAGQIKPLKSRLAGTSAGLTIWPQAPEHSPTISQTPYPHDPVIVERRNPLGIYWLARRCFAEEATMRTIVLGLLALAGISLTSTDADAGAWCASYRRGVSNCGYSSYEQCRATVLGLGGFCRPNPFPGTAYGTGAGSWNTPGSPRRYRRSY